ncbi:YdiK family protein [Aquisalibacillus elongatus]|uniref:Uncharacterized protein DUF4305 n=1 Tax=Aquisalibacillus elongatus TaxID=485577 RepID=A0A3N5CB37_9BACI|nr:YdiK family protein [Aquisalibacillus elongatus]RPF57042.1 uncharacterized protein DUF4305 [Aquisalibacillus elongatus]
MKASPVFLATMYFLIGIGFMYLALQSADETIWNAATIIFTVIAALNIGVAIRMMARYYAKKLNDNKKE